LAWFLAERRGPDVAHDHEAYELSKEANELTRYRDSNFLDTFALAAARVGKFGQAAELQQRALELLPEASNSKREEYKRKLENYLRQKT
jgi:Tfp pilus assembly protein PilF